MSARRDTAALDAYLREHFAPATVSELDLGATGASNDTLFFTAEAPGEPARRYVLRAQSGGHQLFLGGEVLLQSRIMRALARSDIPVPEIVLEEPDASIFGSPFFVMTHVPGRSIPVVPSWHGSGWLFDADAAQRGRVWRNAVEMTARVGRIHWAGALAFLDAPAPGERGLDRYLGYVEEWFTWAANGRAQPVADVALAHVREHQPRDVPVELVWGDATLANMIYADDDSIAAVLDWEMATLGPAELDLGWFLFMSDMYSRGFGLPRLDGLPSRVETAELFARALGRPLRGDLRYWEILGGLRMAIVTMRFADIQVQYGTLPPGNTLGTNNPATNVLAEYLGLERPSDSADLETANRAVTAAQRGRS